MMPDVSFAYLFSLNGNISLVNHYAIFWSIAPSVVDVYLVMNAITWAQTTMFTDQITSCLWSHICCFHSNFTVHIVGQYHKAWVSWICLDWFAGEVMTSFNCVVIPTPGNWFQTNTLEHEHDETDSWVHLLCVFYQWQRYSNSVTNYDRNLSLYCGSVKPKFKTGSGY